MKKSNNLISDRVLELDSYEWKKTKEEIFKRDGNKCTKCNSTDKLICSHKLYVKNKKVWDYDKVLLTTLCSNCHNLKGYIETVSLMSYTTIVQKIGRGKVDTSEVKVPWKQYRGKILNRHKYKKNFLARTHTKA